MGWGQGDQGQDQSQVTPGKLWRVSGQHEARQYTAVMTDPARQSSSVADLTPHDSASTGAPELASWQSFARQGDWQRAQMVVSLREPGSELHATLQAVAAIQEDVRARKYGGARRALTALKAGLGELARHQQGDAALLESLVMPERLGVALEALDRASGEADPLALQGSLAEAEAHGLTRAEARNAVGVLHALRSEPEAAKRSFDEALAHDAGHYRARMNLGNLALEAGDARAAEEQYREVLKIAPQYDGAHHNLGVALRRQGKVYESVGSIRKAQRLNVKRTQLESREELKDQMQNNPQMRRIRNVMLGVILAVVVLVFLLNGR